MLKIMSRFLLAVGISILLMSVATFAQAKNKPAAKIIAEHAKCADSTNCNSKGTTLTEIQIWNKICPVKGEKVDSKVQTVEYQNKTIGFCCKGCASKFKKDPAKYMKMLNENGTKYLGS